MSYTSCICQIMDVVRVTKGGFGQVETVVEGLDSYRGHKVKVLAKNENYLIRCVEGREAGVSSYNDGAVLACTPDLICVVDSETGTYVDRATWSHNIIVFFTTYFFLSVRLSYHHKECALRPASGCPGTAR